MYPAKNGVSIGTRDGDGAPYEVWRGDLFACPTCKRGIVGGWGRGSVAMRHEANFDQEWLDADFLEGE